MSDTDQKPWRDRWAYVEQPSAKKKTKAQQAADERAEQDQQASPTEEHEKSVELPEGDDSGDTPAQE